MGARFSSASILSLSTAGMPPSAALRPHEATQAGGTAMADGYPTVAATLTAEVTRALSATSPAARRRSSSRLGDLSSAQGVEGSPDLRREEFRLLPGGEVAAPGRLRKVGE